MVTNSFNYTERRALARAWQDGGCASLSRQLSKIRPHFTVKEYGAAVQAAREESGDTTDYSADYAAASAARTGREESK